MRILSLFFWAASFSIYPQNVDTVINIFHKQENILKFADHLFCQKDYLRASDEYLRLSNDLRDDEINFKIALSYSSIEDYSKARLFFSKIQPESNYFSNSSLEQLKIIFLEEKYFELRKSIQNNKAKFKKSTPVEKLFYLSYLKDNENLPPFEEFSKPFSADELKNITALYNIKLNPSEKSPTIAAILSAMLPGAGKIYTGEIGDGIYAFLSTGLFAFLAYDSFKANHEFRGWLFSGLASGFYSGNIYGSAASAQINNARLRYEFNLSLDSFLKSVNFFIPTYEFCE